MQRNSRKGRYIYRYGYGQERKWDHSRYSLVIGNVCIMYGDEFMYQEKDWNEQKGQYEV